MEKTNFRTLFTKFCNGLEWLDRQAAAGKDVSLDFEDFQLKVVEPLEAQWSEMAEDEKKKWLWVLGIVRKFGAVILPR